MKQRKGLATLILLGVALFGWTSISTHADTVWTKPVTKSLSIGATNIEELHVTTHNGSITFTGDADKPPAVTVTLKGGGANAEQAGEALEAIELLAPSSESGEAHLGWRWKDGDKRRNWQASVSFDIMAPPALGLYAQTHNGSVKIIRVDGDVVAETHNGRVGVSGASSDVVAKAHNGSIEVDATGKKLKCQTHNGSIDVQFTGSSIDLKTHNGTVVANVVGAMAISGGISTHNGSAKLLVGEKTATSLKCATHRGGIHYDVPLSALETTKRKLTGNLGGGGATLAIDTYNGTIEVLAGS